VRKWHSGRYCQQGYWAEKLGTLADMIKCKWEKQVKKAELQWGRSRTRLYVGSIGDKVGNKTGANNCNKCILVNIVFEEYFNPGLTQECALQIT